MHEYEVYAVKYGHHERRSSQNFIGGDEQDRKSTRLNSSHTR